MPNPLLGVLFHWLGGLAAGSFYAPYRKVRGWSWETYWLVGGVFSWIVAPWLFAVILLPGVVQILTETPPANLVLPFLFGAMWGIGGLTFGLTMRYLGMSLGMAVALGYCAVFGTLMPPIVRGTFLTEVLSTTSGQTVLAGVTVCVLGIAVAGLAGMSKEREMPEEEKKAAIKEFDFKKGLAVATVSGIMSSCFAFGLAAGEPIKQRTVELGANAIWQGLPVLIVVMLGGFVTNFLWCVTLNFRNKTGGQYFSRESRDSYPTREAETIIETAFDAPSEEAFAHASVDGAKANRSVSLAANWLLCAMAGTIWYLQFFFYSMGESQMGAYGFSSWTMHMASIIIFSTLWGIALKEWAGASQRTWMLLVTGLVLLVLSTIVVGYGNYLAGAATLH